MSAPAISDNGRLRLLDELPAELLDQLLAFYENEWWTRGRSRADVERMLVCSTEIVAAVLGEGEALRLAGFGRALSDGAFRAIVFDMIVAPERRGTGLGRRILEELLARPSLAASSSVELMCLPEMAPFYERLGFKPDDSGVLRMRRPRD